MKKFNGREAFLILNALSEQKKEAIEMIEAAENKGRRPLFTANFIRDEHKYLMEKVKSHTKKKDLEVALSIIEASSKDLEIED